MGHQMSKRSLALSKKAVRNIERTERALAEPDARAGPIADPIADPVAGRFFSFRCTYTEISAVSADRAKLKRSETRLEHGKLAHETFEGEFQRSALDPLLNQAREQFAQQTALLMRSLTWFLPAARKPPSDSD
jgi:hypothetical protein